MRRGLQPASATVVSSCEPGAGPTPFLMKAVCDRTLKVTFLPSWVILPLLGCAWRIAGFREIMLDSN